MGWLYSKMASGAHWLAASVLVLLGGPHEALTVLCWLILLDFAAAYCRVVIKDQHWEWRKMYLGILKKLLYFLAIVSAVMLERLARACGLDIHAALRRFVLIAFCGVELRSFWGHLKVCGVACPPAMRQVIKTLSNSKVSGDPKGGN